MTDHIAELTKKVPRFALRPPIPSEEDEQIALFAWARAHRRKYPELRWLHASLNGMAASSPREAKQAKRAGMESGVPDVFLPVPRGKHCGLYIEMKRSDKTLSDLSESQREWKTGLTENGYRAEVSFNWEQAKDFILEYLGG
jgi:hypothetical protein